MLYITQQVHAIHHTIKYMVYNIYAIMICCCMASFLYSIVCDTCYISYYRVIPEIWNLFVPIFVRQAYILPVATTLHRYYSIRMLVYSRLYCMLCNFCICHFFSVNIFFRNDMKKKITHDQFKTLLPLYKAIFILF